MLFYQSQPELSSIVKQLIEELVSEVQLQGKRTAWDLAEASVRRDELLQDADQVRRAKLMVASDPLSGAWLNTFPYVAIGERLDDTPFQMGIALRVGAKMCVGKNTSVGVTE